MGWAYAGETGVLAGFSWALLVNMQRMQAWYRSPWLHAGGMVAGYLAAKTASAWEDAALQQVIQRYERKGYVIPEDRKALFQPEQYK